MYNLMLMIYMKYCKNLIVWFVQFMAYQYVNQIVLNILKVGYYIVYYHGIIKKDTKKSQTLLLKI